jgi:3-methyladenine DNA glycosylase Tag
VAGVLVPSANRGKLVLVLPKYTADDKQKSYLESRIRAFIYQIPDKHVSRLEMRTKSKFIALFGHSNRISRVLIPTGDQVTGPGCCLVRVCLP